MDEYLDITLSDVTDTGAPWTSRDFVRHYYRGRGRAVTVRETGHLTAIVERYMSLAKRGLNGHIAREARRAPNGDFADEFERPYKMTFVSFPIGDTTIGGDFFGQSVNVGNALEVSGRIDFWLRDEFADPVDIAEAQQRLPGIDAEDVEVIDLGETIYSNILGPLEDEIRDLYGLPGQGPFPPGVHTGEPIAIADAWTGHFQGKIHVDGAKCQFRLE